MVVLSLCKGTPTNVCIMWDRFSVLRNNMYCASVDSIFSVPFSSMGCLYDGNLIHEKLLNCIQGEGFSWSAMSNPSLNVPSLSSGTPVKYCRPNEHKLLGPERLSPVNFPRGPTA